VAFIFWGWHALMVFWLGSASLEMNKTIEKTSSAAGQAGAEAGAGIGIMLIIFVWAAGTGILAIPFMLTRGNKRWVESGGN